MYEYQCVIYEVISKAKAHNSTNPVYTLHVYITNLWRAIEGVCIEDGLDHDQALCHVLLVELVAIVGGLIWTVVEHLQELRPAQVEHELEGGREGGREERQK